MIRQQWLNAGAGVFSGMVLMSSDLRLAVNTFDTVSLYAIMALHHVVQASLEKAVSWLSAQPLELFVDRWW
jgi:hypothetical protein